MDGRRAVVIDNGSGFLKAGFAGAKEPPVIFPAVVGKKKPKCRRASLAEHYTGEEAVMHRSNVTLRHPVDSGVVNQWTEMELVWDHAFHRLPASPQGHPVLLTESVLNPQTNRRRTVETFLETFRVPGVIVADTPSLCLYAAGEDTTGLVLESGYSATYAVPIVRGKVMRSAVTRLDLGGNDLTVFLLRLVESRGSFFPPAKREMFSEVKEKLCYIAMNFAKEEETVKLYAGRPQCSGIKQCYNLAGDTVTLEMERFQCPESLFQPNWLRVDALGVHQLIHDAIEKCPTAVHGLLYENIIVTGGSTCFPGFMERLEAEVCRLCPEDCFVNISAPHSPKTLAWKGGSEFCMSQDVSDKWITLKEYQEVGEDILERKRGILKVEEGDDDLKTGRDTADSTKHRDIHLHKPSRGSSRTTNSSTPGSGLSKKSPHFSPVVSTPSLSEHGTTDFGVRGSRMSGGTQSASRDTAINRTFGHSTPGTSGLSALKRKDEVRPKSPGVYEKHFQPTLPYTPELGDDGEILAPLQPSAQKHRHTRQDQENSSEGIKTSTVDLTCFRRLSLFDHLMDEVATFSPRSEKVEEDEEPDWNTTEPYSAKLLHKMKLDDLMPGDNSLSGLKRDETINFDMFMESTHHTSEQSAHHTPEQSAHHTPEPERQRKNGHDGSTRSLTVHCALPLIEITTCPTPNGSASTESASEQPSPIEYESKRITFNFD